jgi:hypothetical protein
MKNKNFPIILMPFFVLNVHLPGIWVIDGLLYCFCYFISKKDLNSEIGQI